MGKQISAQIVADSVNIQGDRITTYVLTYPRMIHAEVMTHRMFSRNAASSRAIPFNKMIKMVMDDPFIPIAWQKDHKGMQGTEYITDPKAIEQRRIQWIRHGRDRALDAALMLSKDMTALSVDCEGVTKQLCNRLLEPFMWYTALVTTTEYDNFFNLRCPKYQWQDGPIFKSWKDLVSAAFNDGASRDWVDGLEDTPQLERIQHSKSGAEIHIQALAEAMWDARNESEPRLLNAGEWHIPFGDQMDTNELHDYGIVELDNNYDIDELKVAVAVARCARLSYMTFEGEIDYKKDIELFQTLYKNKHMSPFEHVAKAMSDFEYSVFAKHTAVYNTNSWTCVPGLTNVDEAWCNNIRGFVQYRFFLENGE